MTDRAAGVGGFAALAAGAVSFLRPVPPALKRHFRCRHRWRSAHDEGSMIWTGELLQLNSRAQQVFENLGLDFFDAIQDTGEIDLFCPA